MLPPRDRDSGMRALRDVEFGFQRERGSVSALVHRMIGRASDLREQLHISQVCSGG